jgi:hexosaminidase
MLPGRFLLDGQVVINCQQESKALAELLRGYIFYSIGIKLQLRLSDSSDHSIGQIHLCIDHDPDGHPEAYRLEITPDFIRIKGCEGAGLSAGIQSFRQLIPAIFKEEKSNCYLPCALIQDQPVYSWRGLHLDVSRHLYPVQFIFKLLDVMALHKLNVFHWHLTDDQGWRIEIKKYPRLTSVGSSRASTPLPDDKTRNDGKVYQGFYTQDEVREIIEYANQRGITIVPEIEMPGHALAALAAYPEFGCSGESYHVATKWGMHEDVFCAGNDETFVFLQGILDEVIDLFPGEYIHIGGDECPKVRWKACQKCQERINTEGLKDEYELQSYFIRRIAAYLLQRRKRLVGWDEILEGGLASGAVVMSWRGREGGIEAAEMGHDVVMSPNTHCYFDYYQAKDISAEPPAIGGFIPVETVYKFDPLDGISVGRRKHVLGGQGNIWTEYIQTAEQVEYMAFPRVCALSEVLWSGPGRDWSDFLKRLKIHLTRLQELNVNYRDLP